MGEDTDIFQNMDKIKMISQMMGSGDQLDKINMEDMTKAMNMAKTLSSLFRKQEQPTENKQELLAQTIEKADAAEEEKEYDTEEEGEPVSPPLPFLPSREVNILNAAIPFLDKDLQKQVYVTIKLMEMKNVQQVQPVHVQSMEAPADPIKKRNGLLRAIQPYLTKEESKQIDLLTKLMEVRKFMS